MNTLQVPIKRQKRILLALVLKTYSKLDFNTQRYTIFETDKIRFTLAGIYIHIPYCKQACFYCDFHFSTNFKSKTDLIEAICKEIELRKDFFSIDETIETIYFGGGSPSILNANELERILETLQKYFTFQSLEITLEANPDDINPAKLSEWKSLGINRLSIGVQSFDDDALKFMNRCHTGKEALDSIKLSQKYGFENLNLDLIFGVPNVDDSVFQNDLQTLVSLNSSHISTYCLTIEPQTVFGKRLKKGSLSIIGDEIANRQYEEICTTLEKNGYDQYEISNFSKPDQYSKHNLSYWQNKKFLGLGPSAHSYDGINRQSNVASNAKFIKLIKDGKVAYETEFLSIANKMNEFILTKLRTKWGINSLDFENCFGIENYNLLKTKADLWISTKDLKIDKNNLILNPKGKLIVDSICENLFF